MIEPRMYVKKCFADLVVKYGSIFGKDKTMTNEQIIINGVDVSGCVNRNDFKLASYDCYLNGGCQCKDNPNCYYKLYKRKQQECEDLKEQIKKHNDDMFKNPPEKRFYCKGCTLPYISKKLKQTLTKIKEIAEDESYIGFWDAQISEILQKISECEGNDE